MRPKYPKPDANQAHVVAELQTLGFCVWDLSRDGGEILDLMVGGWDDNLRGHRWVAVEIKGPRGRLTQAQRCFCETWPELPWIIAHSTEDVLRAFGRIDE